CMEAGREGGLLRKHRQQDRARPMAREVVEPGADHGLGGFAVDERRAERRIGIDPADHDWASEAVAMPLDAHGKQSDETRCGAARPDQGGGDVASEHWCCGDRKLWLVEHVWYERASGERAPFRLDRGELRERADLALISGFDSSVHGRLL